LKQLADARAALPLREKALETLRSAVATREREAEQHRATAARLRADLQRARAMGPIRRFFSGLDPEALEKAIVTTDRSAQATAEAARSLAGDLPKIQVEIDTLRGEIDRLSVVTQPYSPEPQIQIRLDTLRTRISEIKRRIAAIDGELAELERQVLARCRILATTVYKTYLDKDPMRQFDIVVVDEASMLMPPLVYHAAGLATQSVTVAGDFRQLPPIVMSDEELAVEWLKCDAFEKAGIPQRLKRREPTPHLVALGTQYRMREPICSVINELFYADHPLHSDPSVNYSGGGFPLSPAPLLYVDTAAFHPWAALRVGTYSRYNVFHALLVRKIVLHLAEAGFLPPDGEPNDAIGVVSPYSAQARLIQTLLDDRLGSRAVGISATVHRFQGNEKRAMVLDLTDSTGATLGYFFKAIRIEEDGARLLNVAASRAKHHVVLVANFEYVRAKAPPNGFARRLIDHFEEHGEALDLDAILPLADRDWVDGLHGSLAPTFDLPDGAAGAFTEGTFYPAFLKDLSRARESIVIFSPFATSGGGGRWVDPLRAALARGVRVRVLTRPPGGFGGGRPEEVAEVVRTLRDLGVAVDLRKQMHEKIAILDGRILWHGSLNILSHSDTLESMLRIESAAACQQLGRFVRMPGGRHEEETPIDAPENPKCPKCRHTTVWNNGRYGIWFECERPDCDGKVDPRRPSVQRGPRTQRDPKNKPSSGPRTRGASRQTGRICPQPGCGGRLVEREGKFGWFRGCSRFPLCRYTEDMN
jgi:ssDNA-binding Zn-finger/Zn-ribbon topoisomerase 1